jgi:hypothetical protein
MLQMLNLLCIHLQINFQWPEYESGGFGLFRTVDKRVKYGKCPESLSGTQPRRYSKSNVLQCVVVVIVVVTAGVVDAVTFIKLVSYELYFRLTRT